MSELIVQHALRVYLSTRIFVARDAELLDEVLRLLHEHLTLLSSSEAEARWAQAQRCLSILALLRDGLHDSEHPELCDRLNSLYSYMAARVVEGAVERTREPVDTARRLTAQLRQAWSITLSEPDASDPPTPRS